MKRRINFRYRGFVLLLLLISCDRKAIEFHSSIEIGNSGLYLERFYSYKGGFGKYELVYFLTDSTNFKKRIGYCDNKQQIQIEVVGDSILVNKFISRNNKESQMIKTAIYSMKNLLNEAEFDE